MIDLLQVALLLCILGFLWIQQTSRVSLHRNQSKIILDTCALIDGRITELVKAGFVPGALIIPEFILHELQLLADGSDAHKRSRARYGLDIVKDLQELAEDRVVIDKTIFPNMHAVDNKLVALAKKLNASLYTTDYNLGKVAEIDGVKVLNVNELAQLLRPVLLPGEQKSVKIVQKGSNAKQGAGYLDDGTLVVVDSASKYVGKTVQVEITKAHQTTSGKMMFGKLASLHDDRNNAKAVKSSSRANPRSLAARLKK